MKETLGAFGAFEKFYFHIPYICFSEFAVAISFMRKYR
jgi:hypothetical protein